MAADRYLKVILTVIALELFWLGVRETAPPVLAQQTPQPVVITGFRVGSQDYAMLPVAVVGGTRWTPYGREIPQIEPLGVRVTQPIQAEIKQPITVQTGTKPLIVDAIAKAGVRPGM